MLSFDYSPLLRNSINSFTLNPLSVAPSACSPVQCQPSRRIIRQTRPQFRRSAHNRVVPRSAFINLVSTTQVPEIYSRVIEKPNSYIIQVRKNNSNNYHGYSVLYKLINDKISVEIQSEADDFYKIYQFDKSLVDIDNVSWQIASGILSITIPKQTVSGRFVLQPSVRVRGASPHIMQDNKETDGGSDCSKLETESRNEQDQEMSDSHDSFEGSEQTTEGQESSETSSSSEGESTRTDRIISIPINFQDSSNDFEVLRPTIKKALKEKEDGKSRTESEAGLGSAEAPSPKLPKLTKRVSLEEVEDEALL